MRIGKLWCAALAASLAGSVALHLGAGGSSIAVTTLGSASIA